MIIFLFFFFQAEDGIRDKLVTGVQTCALPILIYLDMSGLIARKQHRPLEQPGITAGTQPLGGPGPARALATGSPAPAPPRAPGPQRASLVASWLFPPASRVPPTPADRGETGCLAFAAQAAWGTEACRRPWECAFCDPPGAPHTAPGGGPHGPCTHRKPMFSFLRSGGTPARSVVRTSGAV